MNIYNTAIKEALKHLAIVFFYSGVSSILPIIIAWMQNDPRWVILTPVINAVWYAITRYLKEKQLIETQNSI
jgi:hypothetical protein